MPLIISQSEAHLSFPIMGLATQETIKQKAIEGVVIEEKVEETYRKAVETLVIPPTLFTGESGQLKVTKKQLDELKKIPAFVQLVEDRVLLIND